MTTTMTVTVGMKQEHNGRDTFIEKFVNAANDDIDNTGRDDWTISADADTAAITITNRTGQTHQRRNITPANFFAGLTEWAEQALLYIEDTNAHWLHNALAVSASSWHRIDLDADDWTEQVALYIADNYGNDI